MAGPKVDPEVVAHLEWIGFVRPVGMVVSAPALVRAGAILDRRDTDGQRLLRAGIAERTFDPKEGAVACLPDFRHFAEPVLGWSFSPRGYAGVSECPIPAELEAALQNSSETLRPDFAVREIEPEDGASSWQLLVRVLDLGEDFDRVVRGHGELEISAHGRMERLLRKTGVAAGLIFNGRALRLISAPYGESSGWIDFRVSDMLQTAGRPIATALRLLLSERRLLSLPRAQRLAALLDVSRKFQNEISERLAEQVLHALYELLRGFQAAHDASKGALLRDQLIEHPDSVYHAMLTIILRLVFLLYAEERDMLPEDETFLRYYSLAGLYERLREDAALFPDTLDQRYGAWAQLLMLFRMIHDGAEAGAMRLPRRHGVLFDPDRFPFLEGRSSNRRKIHERIEAPLVPDGTIYRALEKLLVLDGERISYRTLDVEQIGSVYETMMGFRLETATGRSAAIKAQKKQGAPTAVDLELLLTEPASKREKWIEERVDRKLTDSIKRAVAAAATVEDLHAALSPVIDHAASPDLVPRGAMVLQPGQERRRSGSHYTPRTLTKPIVLKTLEPLLASIRGEGGRAPRPEQVLGLKLCDPAMGSGAFLVEVCRQLGDALIESWRAHGSMPAIPPDEDEVIFARRLIAQRCLYGVDRNPVAVDLAKASLWLATLAKGHALTFLDHALRHGDSLLGLSRRQIEGMSWEPSGAALTGFGVRESVNRVFDLRRRIREADENVPDAELRELWSEAKVEIDKVRLCGDLVIAAFLQGGNSKGREEKLSEYVNVVLSGNAGRQYSWLEEQRHAEVPLVPFHWEIEFPEVFARENAGFDGFIGNPPFAGKNTIAASNVPGYPDWLKQLHEASHGNADLVAHFFRRAFNLLRSGGVFGLIATKTIREGHTRGTGLRWICEHAGEIYSARRRLRWPGLGAAVTVSIVHVMKGQYRGQKRLDDQDVAVITGFLFHRGGNEDPGRLAANAGKSFQGSAILGRGFTFDDTDSKGVATSLAEMHRLLDKDERNGDAIAPYIGYAEVANSPTHSNHRYVINFCDRSEEECRERWPDLMAIVEQKVRPERESNPRKSRSERWWQYGEKQVGLYRAIAGLTRVLVAGSQASAHFAFAFIPPGLVYSSNLSVIAIDTYAGFASLQSRVHEIWGRFFMSTLGDSLAYTPTSCFEPYPFPRLWASHPALEEAGRAYYSFRSELMVEKNEGLTEIYNRFHDPDECGPEILRLRQLHSAMDRAVLDAYDWRDIPTDCEFLLDYEIDEEELGEKKTPLRLRFPDDVHDELLARLLERSAQLTAEEVLSGAHEAKRRSGKKSGKRATVS